MIDTKNKSKIASAILSNREGGAGVKDAMLRRVEIDVLESKNVELRQQLADVSHERDLLRAALSGMLFEFDDGVGEDWSSDLLDQARTLCDAVEFKPSAEVKS